MFDEIPEKDIISWTSMISGLVQCQYPSESLDLFCQMQGSGFEPDGVILTGVLSACASLGLLDCGRWVHQYIDQCRIKWDVHIGTTLVDMVRVREEKSRSLFELKRQGSSVKK
ncbi:Pentatricopeptide repeat-containing protein [Vigna angularis]|uniref:Pentatricopeptide repeat-containing protein n=1 Tax=Phaseolus angularis TaxID=3914 RepID=A0A8T0JH45_PHAAN|nr:Pentatricopeptide repeat-containing protein [Vigna angularis]